MPEYPEVKIAPFREATPVMSQFCIPVLKVITSLEVGTAAPVAPPGRRDQFAELLNAGVLPFQ